MRHGVTYGGAALGYNRSHTSGPPTPAARAGRSNVNRRCEAATRGAHMHGDNPGLTWFTPVGWIIELAPGCGAFDGAPMWVDITSYVRSFATNGCGRDNEFSQFGPGTATVVLSNADRRFDPTHAYGPYYGQLVPRVPIRIRYIEGTTVEAVFTGVVKGWPQTPVMMSDNEVALSCVDAFDHLQRSPLDDSAYALEVVKDQAVVYYPDQDPDGVEVLDRMGRYDLVATTRDVVDYERPVGAESIVTYTYGAAITPSGTLPSIPARTFDAWVVCNTGTTGAWTYRAGTNDFLQVQVSIVGAVNVRYSHAGSNRNCNSSVSWLVPFNPVRLVHLAVVCDNDSAHIYVDGTEVGTITLSVGTSTYTPAENLQIDAGSIGAHAAWYAGPLDAKQVQQHYLVGCHAWGHPIGERSAARFHRILDAIGWDDAARDVDPNPSYDAVYAATGLSKWRRSIWWDGSGETLALAAGDTVHDAYTPGSAALSALQEIEVGEQGLMFVGRDGKVSFRSRQWLWSRSSSGTIDAYNGLSGSPVTAYAPDTSDEYMRNQVTVDTVDGTRTVTDAVSIARYGRLDWSVSAPTIVNAWLGKQLAAMLLRLHKAPTSRVETVEFAPRTLPVANRATLMGLDAGEWVFFLYWPQSVGDTISVSFQITGIDHAVDAAGNWTMRLRGAPLAPLRTAVPYMLMGHATYGVVGTTNLIPF